MIGSGSWDPRTLQIGTPKGPILDPFWTHFGPSGSGSEQGDCFWSSPINTVLSKGRSGGVSNHTRESARPSGGRRSTRLRGGIPDPKTPQNRPILDHFWRSKWHLDLHGSGEEEPRTSRGRQKGFLSPMESEGEGGAIPRPPRSEGVPRPLDLDPPRFGPPPILRSVAGFHDVIRFGGPRNGPFWTYFGGPMGVQTSMSP